MLSPAGKEFSLYGLLDMVRRRKLLVMLPVLAAASAAAAYAFYRPVFYRAQTLLGVDSNARDYIQRGEPNARVQDQLLTIREVLMSREVLEPVLRRKLSDPDLEEVRKKIKITVETDDSFHLGFEAPDRVQAMNVANGISGGFIQRLGDMRRQQVGAASGLLDDELERLRTSLNEQEQQVMRYKARAVNELPDRLEANLKMYAETQAKSQSTTSAKANDQARLSAVEAEMADLQKQGVLEPPQIRVKTAQEIQLEDQRQRVKQMRAMYTEVYPERVAAERELADLEKTVAATPPKTAAAEPSLARMRFTQLAAEKESLQQRLKSYSQEEGTLESQMGRLQARVQTTPQHEIAIGELNRGYEATKTRYNALLAKQQEVRLTSKMEQAKQAMTYRIIEPATLPAGPSTPRRSRLLLMGLCVGLALGLGLAFAVEQTDTAIGGAAEFQSFTDLPVVAALPTLSSERDTPTNGVVPLIPTGGDNVRPAMLSLATLHANHIVALTAPASVATEQYRVLGLKLRKRFSGTHCPIIAISSFAGGEGKTVTSLNLSLALAGCVSGRVLLIDSDLRKPRVHEYLGIPPSSGFSDLLQAPGDALGKYVWKLKDLYLMTGGSNLANPVALLSSKNTQRVLDRLRAEFDLIIIDTPPTLPVVDAHILAGMADGVAIVVRARHTRRETIGLGLENFQGSATLAGAIMNDTDYEGTGYAHAYQYYSSTYMSKA